LILKLLFKLRNSIMGQKNSKQKIRVEELNFSYDTKTTISKNTSENTLNNQLYYENQYESNSNYKQSS